MVHADGYCHNNILTNVNISEVELVLVVEIDVTSSKVDDSVWKGIESDVE